MTEGIEHRKKRKQSAEGGSAFGGSTLLSLSLYIILLAFFIVLNAISEYSEPKVKQAFDSIDMAFATDLMPPEFAALMQDQSEPEQGGGDSMEGMQNLLKSILPGLDVSLTGGQDDGHVMAVRMEKDKFERLTPQLIPLFIRILNVKDGNETYELFITSYVRNSLNEEAKYSFSILQDYKDQMVKKGLASNRIALGVELGNPAYMLFRFDKRMGAK